MGAKFDFFSISTEHLVRISPLKFDIYIRLSEKKFLKFFRVGDVFDYDDLERYRNQKKISQFYALKNSGISLEDGFEVVNGEVVEKLSAQSSENLEAELEAILNPDFESSVPDPVIPTIEYSDAADSSDPEIPDPIIPNIEYDNPSVATEPDFSELEKKKKKNNFITEEAPEPKKKKEAPPDEDISALEQRINEALAQKDMNLENAVDANIAAQAKVNEMAEKLGVSAEMQDLVKKNMKLTVQAVGKNPKLGDLIKKITREGNYLSQHSTLLSFFSCSLAKELDYGSDTTYSKLVMASFMHDVFVTNPALAKMHSLVELKKNEDKFTSDESENYPLHPVKGAELMRRYHEVPPDVDTIIAQHHELPNGKGFPRGLTSNYIAPLSAIFIVAHDAAQDIIERGESFVLSNWIESRKDTFNKGNFRKALVAMEKVKLGG